MGSESKHPPKLWIETPCIYSAPISRAAGCNIYLKLENLQPSGSFKSRAIGNLMLRAVERFSSQPGQTIRFYCSSGGNAGLAAITAANALQRPATIVVPTSTLPHMVAKLRALGAEVVQLGDNWAAADAHLRQVVMPAFERAHPGARAVYIPPFDHPDVWAGASTLVAELREQMGGDDDDDVLDGIVCSVGGGGLLCGIMQGLHSSSNNKMKITPKVLAVETPGSDSLYQSVQAGELVTLPAITTIATSLGATRVADEAFAWTRREAGALVSAVVTDRDCVVAMCRFLDDARMLVESACGATIATAYNGDLRRHLGEGLSDEQWARKNVVLVVCGGSNISLAMLDKYKAQFGV